MPKQNCNNGCLEIISGACVKYTGPTILKPAIPTNTDINTAIATLANNKSDGGQPQPGGSCAKAVTYAELRDLYENDSLESGCWYRVTDFRTVHQIYNIQVDPEAWGGYSITNTEEVYEGPVEQLILMHTGNGGFSGYTEWGDFVIYALDADSTVLPGSTHGVILRRIDDYNNISLPMDWRNIIWRINGQNYHTFNGDGSGNPQNYRGVTRNIYVGGGPEYRGMPIVIFTNSSPYPVDINLSIVKCFIIYHAENIHAPFVDVVMPNATLRSIFTSNLSGIKGDWVDFGGVYDPDYRLPIGEE